VAQATALGPLQVLVNCAGVGWGARIVGKNGGPHDLALFRRILDINLVGTFNMLRLAAVAMATNDLAEGEEQEPGQLTDHLRQIALDEGLDCWAVHRQVVVELRVGLDDRADLAGGPAGEGLDDLDIQVAALRRADDYGRGPVPEQHA
jgi:hypothetical protein